MEHQETNIPMPQHLRGDAFLVLPVPRDREPDEVKEPVVNIPIVPIPKPVVLSPIDRMMRVLNPLFMLPIFVLPTQQIDIDGKTAY